MLAGPPPTVAALALQPAPDCVLLSERAMGLLLPDRVCERMAFSSQSDSDSEFLDQMQKTW